MNTRHFKQIANGLRTASLKRHVAALCLLAIGFAANDLAAQEAQQRMAAANRLPPVTEPSAAPETPAAAANAAPQPPVRSEEMELIARQSDEKIRDGMELAERGAAFAARADFVSALRLIAQGLDNDEAAQRHSQALGAALTAMQEAKDFVPAPGKVESQLELGPIVAGHQTPLLKDVPAERLQAMRALRLYFTYAQEQLCVAAGHEVSASMALAALGKLHAAMAEKENPELAIPDAKAIVFYQAAIMVLPQNYIAANDLGVLLAHRSDYAAARTALEHSVQIYRCSENLQNLSGVYRQLGEPRLAEMAARDAEAARAAERARKRAMNAGGAGGVQWVDADTLARSSNQWTDLPARPSATAATRGAAAPSVGQAPGPFGSMQR